MRSFGLALTEDGKSALEEHYKKEMTIISTMLEVFDDGEERENFIKLFNKLVNNIV